MDSGWLLINWLHGFGQRLKTISETVCVFFFFLQVYLMICSNSFSGFGRSGSASAPVLLLCGGFLGAGKTTAITALARACMQNGLRAALIVNDQAGGLVDQASALATGSPAVGEVAGGCFCCKLSALTETLNQLGKDHQPDVFFAGQWEVARTLWQRWCCRCGKSTGSGCGWHRFQCWRIVGE